MAGRKKAIEKVGYSLAAIADAVRWDAKGQSDVAVRLGKGDSAVAFDLIVVALYKAFRRRGVSYVDCLSAVKNVVDKTNIKVEIR